jgi:cobalamin biosynthetic protein CobC
LDDAWLAETTKRVDADSMQLERLLIRTGFTIVGGTPLFLTAGHPDAPLFVDALARSGIHVRRFAHEPSWLRFGLPANESEFSRLAKALSQ